MCEEQKIRKRSYPVVNRQEAEELPGARSMIPREAVAEGGADLFERILERNNLNRAYKQVKRNGGAPGVDGMTVDELLAYLREHKEGFLESLRTETYRPKPVRRVNGRIAGSWILPRSLTNRRIAEMGYDDIQLRYNALHSSY